MSCLEDESPDAEFDGNLEDNECVYNMNMFSVLSWRFSTSDILTGSKAFYLHWIVLLFRFLPFVLVWCEVVVLVGILDEGAKIKYLIEHDKTFQFPKFIWSKTAPQTKCDAITKMQSWFQDQMDAEVVNCATFGPQLANFSHTVSFASDNFFNLYAAQTGANFSEDLTYVFTHCFPWAYADVCANIMSARPDIEAAAAAGLGGCNSTQFTWDTCAYRNCYLPLEASTRFGGASRISADIWRSISVSGSEIDELVTLAKDIETSKLITLQRQKRALFLAAFEKSEVRRVYEEHSDFICWFMKQMLNRRKYFSSTSDELSMYLFQQLHWVYALGVGETHIVELIAIVFLSFYVYTTAMYDELMQLLYQLRAHFIFSGPAYVNHLLHGVGAKAATDAAEEPRAHSLINAAAPHTGPDPAPRREAGLSGRDYWFRYLQVLPRLAAGGAPAAAAASPSIQRLIRFFISVRGIDSGGHDGRWPAAAGCGLRHLLRRVYEPPHHLLRVHGAGAPRGPGEAGHPSRGAARAGPPR